LDLNGNYKENLISNDKLDKSPETYTFLPIKERSSSSSSLNSL
jgi:hypothetical protein